MQTVPTLTRDLVLIGGGHAHALVLRMWGMRPLAGVRLTLIDPSPVAPYTGMLPGLVAGHYQREMLDIDLVRLARFAGARLILGAVTGIDSEARAIHVEGRGDVSYDVVSINVGIHSAMPEIEGFADHAHAAKPLGPFAKAWEVFCSKGGPSAVIGGGVAGCELAMAMAHATGGPVTVIETAEDIGQPRLHDALQKAGITVITNATATQVTANKVVLADGREVVSQFTTGAAGGRGHQWVQHTGLSLTDGFIRVGPDLRAIGHEDVFAVGDCAYLTHAPRPKAGVFAVRAAPVLYHNLRAVLMGAPLRKFRPQRRYLKLVSLGDKSALAERGGMVVQGTWLWRWKNWIDRRFMNRLNKLPRMEPPAAGPKALGDSGSEPLCGGCGSKVGPDALAAALPATSLRSDVVMGAGDDAAVLQVGDVQQVLTTDHLRAFTLDYGLMGRIAALHALGDILAMGAQAQSAMVQLTLPRMSEPLQSRTLAEIMEAATEVFHDAGADIIGGHTTMGAELTIGFSLTGLLKRPAITTSGARPSDVIVLTRGIGSGVLLAAEMQGHADGRDISVLWDVLAQPQFQAGELLREAHAMTDVTGFGLAGHLAAICQASGVGATLDLNTVPVLPGAEELAGQGLRSTIWEANKRHAPVEGASGPLGDLLYDPQTAGGFLAALSEGDAKRITEALPEARIIGRFTDRAGWIGVT